MKKLIEKIQELKAYFPLEGVLEKSLKDFLDVKYNYNTNALEWTTLTEQETSFVLRGETIPKHSLIEHFEVINHKNAFNYIFKLTNGFRKSKDKFENIFTEKNILDIHSFILQNIQQENAGVYRRQNVRIAFSQAILPRYEKVPQLMKDFLKQSLERCKVLDIKNTQSILEFWYDLHLNFVKIHPFVDWNGRTARLIMNLWFLYALNNINIIYFTNRSEYIEALEQSQKNLENYHTFMHKNFLEFKEEESELVKNKIIWKY